MKAPPNVVWHSGSVTRAMREQARGHKGAVVWLTGLSGSGKSTVANALEARLFARGVSTYLLDGDNVRHGLSSDLGFGEDDRRENMRRIGEVARLFVDAGLVVVTAFISPFREERDAVRARFEAGSFVEVFVDADLATCEGRDPKGLYAKARAGDLPRFTGIDSPYEAPLSPEVVLKTASVSPEDCATTLEQHLVSIGVLR